MYTEFYGLREKPFSLTPDPQFLFLSHSHREALAHVLYGIDQGEGFICLTGEVGTGKTTLCRTLLQRLGSGTEVAFLFNPPTSGDELLRAINQEFGLPAQDRNRVQLNDQLNEFLLVQKREGRRVLLIVDEAQTLTADTLEAVRLLSNLETSTSKLIQILLFGQPELDAVIDSPELRQLRQRISVRWSLEPMTARESRDYVHHRLRIAAGRDVDLFADQALQEIWRRTGGTPRLLNVLCDRALLAGYAEGASRIGREHVKQASREILSPRSTRDWRALLVPALGAAALLAASVALLAWNRMADDPQPPAVSAPGPAVAPAAPVRGEAPARDVLQTRDEAQVRGEPGDSG